MNLYPEFEGKVVVMTGVSSGIGLEQAKAFLQAGAIVYGADIKESAEIKEVEQKFPTLSFQQVDIRKKKDIHMWTEKIKKELSTVDILLNTAAAWARVVFALGRRVLSVKPLIISFPQAHWKAETA